MNNIEQNIRFWDDHFSKYGLDYPNEQVVRFMAKFRNEYPSGTFLDWGCATGRHVILGSKFGYKVYAVDYVNRCIEITKKKVQENGLSENDIVYIVHDGLSIPEIQDNSINIILLWGVMMGLTLEQQRCLLKDVYRMLSDGGRAFIDFRTKNDSLNISNNSEKINTKLENAYVYTSELEEIRMMVKESGLIVEDVEKYEFTENNCSVLNSWWHIIVRK